MTQTPPQTQTGRQRIRVVNTVPTRRPEADAYQFADLQIVQQCDVAVANSPTIDSLLGSVARIVSDQSDCLGLWACQQNENGDFGSAHNLSEPDAQALWTVVEDHARKMILRVAKTRQICSSPIRSQTQTELVVAPITTNVDLDSPIRLVLIGCFSAAKQSVLRHQWLIGLISQTISRWHQHRALKHLETKSRSLNDTIGLVHALDQTGNISEASMVMANHLRRICQAEQVAISFSEPMGTGKPKGTLQSVSDVENVDLSSESNKIINNACNQAIISGQTICYPSPDANHSPALLALDKYCKSNVFESCINVPLITDDGRTIGSILVAIPAAQIGDEHYRQYLGQIVKMVTGHFDVVIRANRGVGDIVNSRWKKLRSAKLTKAILIGLACLTGLMFTPLPYRVACDCEVQPVMRRFIASPHDGILQETLVESGDLVESGQVVARLDGRQMRIELSGLRAEYDGARKRRDSALATGDVAQSQIARSEMNRYQSKIEILEQQLTNLEVRSPIPGIVVSGDLEKVEGAPLDMGQTLFEIAPLDQMLAEIGIPESEINYVEPGMEVAIKLNAFPFKTWTGIVQQIHPRTEVIEDESVFVAQVVLTNEELQLRPGMKGSAKIKTQYAPLGWNLFHQSWESIRYWMIW
jgi:hypothetical protein